MAGLLFKNFQNWARHNSKERTLELQLVSTKALNCYTKHVKGDGTAQQWTQTHGTSFSEVQVPCEYSNYRSLFLEFLREQNWSLLQVLTLWKAEIDWCSKITDSVAYERTSEIFPSIATRPDSEFSAQCMHSTTSWNMSQCTAPH